MADRLKTLQRLGRVQADMVKLAEWRLAAAERICRDLDADKVRLRDYVSDETALGVPLARAALKSLGTIENRAVAAERLVADQRLKLDALRRREKTIDSATQRAGAASRRDEEQRSLTETMDAWLARRIE